MSHGVPTIVVFITRNNTLQHQVKRVDMQCGNDDVCPIINSGMRKS